jgi:DNA-binding response OmpR family regulator
MRTLKSYSIVLVGTEKDKVFFQTYFTTIHLVKNNREALHRYKEEKATIVLLSHNSIIDDAINICKEIREDDRKTILVLLFENITHSKLLQLLPLHLSGYVEKTFTSTNIQRVLQNIKQDLNLLTNKFLYLNEEYAFNRENFTLYKNSSEIKLTKNEIKLINILDNSEERYVHSEIIEHNIWEKDSAYADCNKRLKYLIYGLRKKLPKESIMNSYNLGYKLMSV